MRRDDALNQLRDFLPHVPAYARDRKHVIPGHENVSRLSPAIRHRLLHEEDVAARAVDMHGFRKSEKFVQEVYWRLYWKSWLEMRPSVWSQYREDLHGFPEKTRTAAEKIARGESGIAIMDHFARELTQTGYLHNHARMWFAGAWVHHFRMPWQLGADFFHRHLLDGDPASNTLSWRWVAGLHATGKTYVARRSNIEKYVHSDILKENRQGLSELESPHASSRPDHGSTKPERRDPLAPRLQDAGLSGPSGLWIHEDDLFPESASELDAAPLTQALALQSSDIHRTAAYSEARQDLIRRGLQDAAERSLIPATFRSTDDTTAALIAWAEEHSLRSIVTILPWVGPLRDALPDISRKLEAADLQLVPFRRESDEWWLPLATAGFFGFWKKACRHKQW